MPTVGFAPLPLAVAQSVPSGTLSPAFSDETANGGTLDGGISAGLD